MRDGSRLRVEAGRCLMRKSWFLLAIPFFTLVYGLVHQSVDVVSGAC